MHHHAKFCQNWSLLLRYHDFDFSRWRPLPSWISEILTFYYLRGPEGRGASARQTSSKSVNSLQRYSSILIFKDGGRPLSWIYLGRPIFEPPTNGTWKSLALCKIWLQSMQ